MDSPRTTASTVPAEGLSEWETADSGVLIQESVPQVLARRLPEIRERTDRSPSPAAAGT